MAGGGRQVVEHSHQGDRQADHGVGPHTRLRVGLGKRLPVQTCRGPVIGLEEVHPGETSQRFRTLRAGRGGRGGRLDQRSPAGSVARLDVEAGRLEHPTEHAVRVLRRGQPGSLLDELGRHAGRAARPGLPRRLVESGGNLGVRLLCGKGEMPRPLLGIEDERG